jgi:hypothetical protein
LDKSVLELFEKLRKTRNVAVHSQTGAITPGEALEYQGLARTVAAAIAHALENLKKGAPAHAKPAPSA